MRAVKENCPGTRGFPPVGAFSAHQRAFVKVQDGCDAFCAYCIVPFTRPVVRSRPADVVLTECRRLVAAGHREIVLCGVFLGAYGRSTAVRRRWNAAPSALEDLLRRVADIGGLWRARLSSLEPGDVTDGLLSVYACRPRVAPHLHLPLQSGSRGVLARMNRQYDPDQVVTAADRLREALDRPALTTDVIVGFPGESEEDFAETLAVARRAGFCKIHAFPFSPVAPTAAWRRRGEAPPPEVVKDRMARLGALEAELAAAYRRRFVGESVEALVESPSRGEETTRHGLTDRYLTVRFPAPAAAAAEHLTGRVVRVAVEAVTDEGLRGRLV